MKKGYLKNNVRQFRRMNDMTQEELADKVGVHRQTIVSIEKQKYEPSVSIVLMLSRILDLPVEKLFFLEEEQR
ncbi:helix-turn-helix transcriptional regulator [Oceanobacillus sp. FSL H7-0719]|uniref:helix-turn-helix transcriptional regulator n=1 Tax=Oceanobacillus sp. FSL H7-0719 TaxID=2954507 RepID=UPI00324BBD76